MCGPHHGEANPSRKSILHGDKSGTLEDYQGQLLLHGMDLKEISRSSLRKIITVISNNSYLFAGTVRETLLEGKQDATEAELMYALQCVKLSDFVMAQGGLDMPISERGAKCILIKFHISCLHF